MRSCGIPAHGRGPFLATRIKVKELAWLITSPVPFFYGMMRQIESAWQNRPIRLKIAGLVSRSPVGTVTLKCEDFMPAIAVIAIRDKTSHRPLQSSQFETGLSLSTVDLPL